MFNSCQDKTNRMSLQSSQPLTPPRSSQSSGKQWVTSPPSQSPSTVSTTAGTTIQQPYLHLLMPEPPPDHLDKDVAQVSLQRRLTLGRRRNKDWRNTPVFDEVDDEDDEPVSPIRRSLGP